MTVGAVSWRRPCFEMDGAWFFSTATGSEIKTSKKKKETLRVVTADEPEAEIIILTNKATTFADKMH